MDRVSHTYNEGLMLSLSDARRLFGLYDDDQLTVEGITALHRSLKEGADRKRKVRLARAKVLLLQTAQEQMPTAKDCAQEILPRMFLGSLVAAKREIQHGTLGVTHLVSLEASWPSAALRSHLTGDRDIAVLHHAIVEKHCQGPKAPAMMWKIFPETLAFVRQGLAEGGVVLLHCTHGVTRSAAIATLLRAKLCAEALHRAYAHIQRVRPVVMVPGFSGGLPGGETDWHHFFRSRLSGKKIK